MRTSVKLATTALAAAALLAIAVGSASATHFSVNVKTFRIVWSPLEFAGSVGSPVRCPVTLEGTFHERSFVKVTGTLLGYVTSALVGPAAQCTNGEGRILPESLPWHVQFARFEGTLPNINTVTLSLLRTAFQIHNTGLSQTCLSQVGIGRNPAAGGIGRTERERGGLLYLQHLQADETISFALTGSGLCSIASGRFAGTGRVTATSGDLIQLFLI